MEVNLLADANHATCPRCGAPVPADVPGGLCPRCLLSDTQGEKTEVPLVNPSFPQRASRKRAVALVVTAIGAILLGGLWFGSGCQRQQSDAKAFLNRGADLAGEGMLDAAIAEFREAIRLQPDYVEAHYNLGVAVHRQGKLAE